MPKAFVPINGANLGAVVNQINNNFARLDREVDTKKYGGRNGTDGVTIGRTGADQTGMIVMQNDKKVLEIGIYQSGRAGVVIYDSNEVPIGLYGQAPDDGRVGAWVAKPGQNVITLLGG